MDWRLVPALLGAILTLGFGVAAAVRPSSLEPLIGVTSTSPLGTSELRAVFGGMFIATGALALITREPLVFLTLGAAWLGDLGVRMVAVAVDHVPARDAAVVLALAALIGGALLSGYWLA